MKNDIIYKSAVLALALVAMPAFADAEIKKGLIAVGFGLAGLGAAVGIGLLAGRFLEAIARQPELESKLFGRFLLTAGLTDAVPLIAIALAFIMLFL
ncbi:MAG: F0F1 ATP synthase subunit C [Gammaproteobacteria bacterium]